MENSLRIKGIEYAKNAIEFTATNPNGPARLGMARAAVKLGNYDDAGRAQWAAYLADGAPYMRATPTPV